MSKSGIPKRFKICIACLTILLNSSLITGVSAQTVIGWRTDGTGRYAVTTPPIKWSQARPR